MIHEEQYKEQYKRYKTTANTEKEYKLPRVPWWGQEVDTEKPGYYSISYNRGALRGGEIRVHFTNDEAGIRKTKDTIPVEQLPYLIQLAIENGEAPQFESLLDEMERLRGEVEKYKKLAENIPDSVLKRLFSNYCFSPDQRTEFRLAVDEEVAEMLRHLLLP